MSGCWNLLAQGQLPDHVPVWLWTGTSSARKETKVERKQPLDMLFEKITQLWGRWGGGGRQGWAGLWAAEHSGLNCPKTYICF